MKTLQLAVIIISSCGSTYRASAIELASPVQCVMGEECFVQNYVDHQAGPGQRDLKCGHRTFDGHNGTDFAVTDRATMSRGVDVLAVANGIVSGTRDGMDDIASNAPGAPALQGKDCGNGVYVNFRDGWAAQYCHMKKGSIAVRKGDQVRVGETVGEDRFVRKH